MVATRERSEDGAGSPASVPGRWKERLDDPFNRFYRYPVARLLVRVLVKTPVTPNQVSFVQPILAGAAGYLVTFPDRRHLVAGALLFELRSILDCADGTLARARQPISTSTNGHAVDAVADWLATALLYAGIFWHFRLYPPPAGAWSHYLSVGGVLLLALAQGALRSFAADHYKLKYTSAFEQGRDGTVEELCRKVGALSPGSSVFARVDALIARAEHLAFEHERYDATRTAPRGQQVARLRTREGTPLARLVAFVWSISNGDAFLSLVTFSLLAGYLWEGQLFFAVAGLPWILLVVALNSRFAREPALWRADSARRASPP
jgi:phosphatidylglycerophosphate synthase